MQKYTETFFFPDILLCRFRRLVTYDFIPWENIYERITTVREQWLLREVLLLDYVAMRAASRAA